jgi:alpha-glucoside transport system permease protein
VGWLVERSINNFALIAIMIWLQTGFCMVLLSAAVKGIPNEIIEAASIDGANEFQIFWRVTIPMIRSTIVVVSTTIIILVLKVFDIVFVMTAGNQGTEVIASRMIKEMFNFRDYGRGSAIAVILLLAVIPGHGCEYPSLPRTGSDSLTRERERLYRRKVLWSVGFHSRFTQSTLSNQLGKV